MKGALKALAFLTPFGRAQVPSVGAVGWFPAVGLLIGAGLGGLWWVTDKAWPAAVAAVVVVMADLAATGMLHFDGLVDSGDGLIAPMDRDRRLVVMSDPGVGAFGLAAAAVMLLGRWAALATVKPAPLLLVGLWCLSRSVMTAVMATQPYARGQGLATAFAGRVPWWPALLGGLAALAAAMSWKPLAGGIAIAAAVGVGLAVVILARRRIGGYTGDVLGAAGVAAETAGLIVAAAKW